MFHSHRAVRATPPAVALAALIAGVAPLAAQSHDLSAQGPDETRLFTAPSGRGLSTGEIQLTATGFWTPFIDRVAVPRTLTPRPHLAVGVAEWMSVHGGYFFDRLPADGTPPIEHDGVAYAGVEVWVEEARRSYSMGAQVNLPLRNDLDRTLGSVVFHGLVRLGDPERSLTLGGGWTGVPQPSGAAWEGAPFWVAGGQWRVHRHVRLLTENSLHDRALRTISGLRVGVHAVSVDLAAACGSVIGGGEGAGCHAPIVNLATRFTM